MLKPALRERLLGALVFLCLGLIFYPVVFDTREDFVIDRETQVPTQLIRVAPMTINEPVPPEQATALPPEDIFVPEESQETAGRSDPSAILNEAGVPNAWVLQVGSFAEQQNATELEQRLVADGYRAYSRRSSASDGDVRYRVFVGPYLDRSIAQNDASALVQTGMSAPFLLEFAP